MERQSVTETHRKRQRHKRNRETWEDRQIRERWWGRERKDRGRLRKERGREMRNRRDGDETQKKPEGETRDSDRERQRAQGAGTAVRAGFGEVEEGRTPLTWRQRRQSPQVRPADLRGALGAGSLPLTALSGQPLALRAKSGLSCQHRRTQDSCHSACTCRVTTGPRPPRPSCCWAGLGAPCVSA